MLLRNVPLVLAFACLASGQAPPVASLKAVQKIYIEKMPNELDQYIRAEISKQLKGRLTVVLNPEDADAIMTGVGEHQTGTRATITGRWLGWHDTATAAISIVDKSGQTVLWSSEAGDRSIWWGPLTRGGPRKVASRLVKNLKNALSR